MRSFLLISSLLVSLVTLGFSQVTYYQFSQGTGSLETQPGSGVTTLVGAASADGASGVVSIGFDVNYAGVVYTQLSASANGLIRLGGTAVTGESANSFTSGTNVPKIMGFWDNMATGTSASGSGVRTWTVGMTPTRKRVVDFKLASNNNTGSAYDFQFQVWIHETSGVIEFVYGAGASSGMSASIGLGGAVATEYMSVTPGGPATVSTSTPNNTVGANPGSGVKYTFTPPAPLTGTKTVGTGMDYPTLKEAVGVLDWVGVGAGGVTFNISGGHTETVPAGSGSTPAGLCIKANGTAANPIIIKWNGVGVKPIFKAGTGVGNFDFVIGICGGDYITLDGLEIQEDNVNNTTNAKRAEIGIGLFKKQYNTTLGNDGCNAVTVKNCKITLTRDPNGWGNYAYCRDYYFSTGIKASAFTSSHQGATNFYEGGNPNGGIKSMTDVHRNCLIIANEIDNCTFGITFADRWAESGGNVFAGAGNIIGQSGAGNTITNWGLKPGSTINYGNNESDMGRVVAGIAIGGQKDYTIEYNTVTTGTTNNLNLDGGPVSYCGILAGTGYDGNHWPQHAAGFFAKIKHNTISGIDVTTGAVDNQKAAYGISFAQFADHVTNTNLSSRPATGNVEITNNTISNITVKGGDCHGISCKYYYEYWRRSIDTDDRTGGFQSSATVTISNNTIKSLTFLTRTSNDAYGHGIFSAIYWMHGQSNLYIENNNIGGAGTDGLVRGAASNLFIARHLVGTRVIYAHAHFDRGTRSLVQINGNTINNVDVIGNASMTAANNWGVGFSGIFLQNGATTNNIQNNQISGCNVANGGYDADQETALAFIYAKGRPRAGTSTLNVSNNTIQNNSRTLYRYYGSGYGLRAFTAGILANYDAGGQVKNIYNNTIDGLTGTAINSTNSHLYWASITGIRVKGNGNVNTSVVSIYDNTIKNLSGDTYSYNHTYNNNSHENYIRGYNTLGINVTRYHRLYVYRNSICDLSTTSTGFTSDQNYMNGVAGIQYGNDQGEVTPYSSQTDPRLVVHNNFIGRLTAPAMRSRTAVVGAYQWGVDHFKLFAHNTIVLGALDGGATGRLTSSTGGAFGVSGFINYDYYRNNKVYKSAVVNNIISINADCKGTGMGTAWRHIELSAVNKAWRGIATYSTGSVYFVNNDANNYIYGQGLTFNTSGGIRNCFGYGTSVTTNATHNLVNDNALPNNFNQICGKYKSFMAGREKGSFIDLDVSNVMKPLPFTGTGGCSAELNIANGADSYVFRGVRLSSPTYYNISADFYGTARGASNVTSGAHENNGNITGPEVQLIDFAYEPICDGVCTGSKSIDVTIKPPSGKTIATAAGKVPRLYFRRIRNNNTISAAQSDNNVMVNAANNNATGTEGWRWVEATTVSGDVYTFDVNEALLKNTIVTTPSYTIEYFIIAETSDGTVCNWTSGDLSTTCPATVDLFSIAGAATVPADDDGDGAIDENSVDDNYTVYAGSLLTKKLEFVNNGTVYTANMGSALPVCTGDEIKVNAQITITSNGEMFNDGCVSFKMEVADNSAFTIGLETFIQSTPDFSYIMASAGTKYFRVWLECGGSNVAATNTPYVFATASDMPVNTSTVAPINSCVGVSQNINLTSSTPTVSKYYWVANPHGKLYVNPPTATTATSQVRAVNPSDTTEAGTWHTYVTLSSGSSLLDLGVKAVDYYDGMEYIIDGGDVDTTKGVAFRTYAMIKLNAISVLDDASDGVGSAGFNISLYSKSGKLLYKTAAQTTTNGQLKQITLTNWYIPPGDYMIVMGASTTNVEPTGGLAFVGASLPVSISATSTPAIDILGGVTDLDFSAYDNGTNYYFFDWDVSIFCTSNDVPFQYIVNPASCCAMPAPAAALIANGTNALGLEASKCANLSGSWIYYFDPAQPDKLLCAVEPNGNTWNPTEINVYNSGASSDPEHVETDGSNTSELMPYMLQVEHTDSLLVNGGVKVRMFYPAAQKSIIDAYSIKRWFKFSAEKQTILDGLEPLGLPGMTVLTPAASGTESGIPYVEFHNITSFSSFGYIGTNCVGTAIIMETDNSCTTNDSKVKSGDAAVLTASGGVSYVWDDASTSAVRTVNPTVATSYTVTVTDVNGCTASEAITIEMAMPASASIAETDNSCAVNDSQILSGDMATLTASGGGTYVWDDASTAAVRSVSPVVNTTYTVTVTNADGCTASATSAITIVTLPSVSIVGSSSICVGETTTLSPNTGGTWASSDGTVATVTNAGVVTGVGPGMATFTFTSSSSGCVSMPTSPVTVNEIPAVSITGASSICVGTSTTLSPSSGGIWVSSDGSVATVTNDGTVTGVSAGSATFTFTNSSTGCVSAPTSAVTVNALPTVSITGSSTICVSATTTLSPSTGGTWTSSNPAVATVTNAGVVTAVSAGTVSFVFTDNVTGCESAPTSPVTVNPLPTVSILGASSICIGEMTGLSPSSGGTWASSNTSIATVTNAGIVTAVAAGTATFTFTNTSTGCVSLPTPPVTVHPEPSVSITGPSSICIGGTTTLTPTDGLWISTNPAVATVTNAGVVTGVSAGSATFIYTNTTTGCESAPTSPVTVNATPAVSITGPSSICVGATTTLSPSSGGTWVSSDPTVATVTNAGVVTGVSAGTATFTFTDGTTGCVSLPTGAVTVNPLPTVSITGPSSICVGATTGLSPTSGGTWASSDNSVATVTNAGIVTGVSAGMATFTFTNTTTGCVSAPTSPVTVNPLPTVSITGSTSICVGANTTLSPSSGGTWVSTNPSVATVTNAGIVTGISAGTATFIFTNSSTGCVSAPTGAVTVNPTPIVSIVGASSICVGETTNLSPSSGGTWASSNPAIATVDNTGLVTSVSAGVVTFTFTDGTTGCVSAPTPSVTVNSIPVVSITGSSTICVGATTTLSPSSGGTWVSSNTAVATVTNAGVVTGVGAGTATFTFTNSSTGCVSAPTAPVTVNALPVATIVGASSICVGTTTTLSPSSGGTWASSNTAVATVTNSGIVSGISAGSATFTFTSSTTGCVSIPTLPVTVNALPVVSITGSSSICVGATTTLSPTTGGTWASSNPAVATVTNAGVVTGVSAGTATFTFTHTATGCISAPTPAVTVNPIPVVSITGSSSICIGGITTLSPTTGGTWASSNPAVATVTNAGVVTGVAAGTATFTFTNTSTGCVSAPTSAVTVNAPPVVSITGSSSICVGTTTTLSPSSGGTWASSNPAVATVTNAGVVTGVSAGAATFTFTDAVTGCVSAPTGAVTVNAAPIVSITGTNNICVGTTTTLSPTSGGTWASSNPAVATVTNAGVVTGISAGTATFTFTNSSTGCVSAPTAPVTVNALPVVNITGLTSICIGSTTTLSPTSGGTWASSNPAIATVTNAGVVTGVAAGTVTFTFTNSSTGCVSLPTASVTVTACNSLAAVKAFLGGPYDPMTDLMNDHLRVAGLIPNAQPYGGPQYADFNYTGTETIGAGVLSVTGNDAIVDWVMLELRDASNPNSVVARKAALIQRDGDVVEASDGVSEVVFVGAVADNYYVAIKHRNHLGVMTKTPIALSGSSAVSINFTSAATDNYKLSGPTGSNHAQRTLANSKRAMWEGNMSNISGSGNQIQYQGANSDSDEPYYTVLLDPGNTMVVPNYIVNGYDRADGNLDGMVIYQGSDSDADIPFFNVLTFPDNVFFLPNFVIFQQIP